MPSCSRCKANLSGKNEFRFTLTGTINGRMKTVVDKRLCAFCYIYVKPKLEELIG